MEIGKYYKTQDGLEFKCQGEDDSNYICRAVNQRDSFLLSKNHSVIEIPKPEFDLVRGAQIRGDSQIVDRSIEGM